MSTCSLQKIFENPPLHAESPTAIINQSFESWKNQIKPIQHSSSFTEIFGELYFNEITPQPSPSRSPSASYSSFPELINHLNPIPINKPLEVENKNSLSCKRNLSLRLERLNICNKSIDLLENLDKVEDLENKDDKENNDEEDEDEEDEDIEEEGEKDSGLEGKWLWKSGRTKRVVNEYPPPISCIGRSGKPCVSFQAYRNNGRFVLKQIPTYDFLHAHREDGRLTLHFVQHDAEDDDDYEEDEYYDSCSKSKIKEEEKL